MNEVLHNLFLIESKINCLRISIGMQNAVVTVTSNSKKMEQKLSRNKNKSKHQVSYDSYMKF